MSPTVGALLVMPGAGAGRDQSALVALEQRLDPLRVIRRDFAYVRAGRPFPGPIDALVEEFDGTVAEVCADHALDVSDLAVGGRSMGGRVASMWAAGRGDRGPAALILMSYPLHPPAKPRSLRTAHFPDIAVPALFVSGTRDDHGSQAALRRATAAIPAAVTHRWIKGGRHDLRGRDGEVADLVASYLRRLEDVTS